EACSNCGANVEMAGGAEGHALTSQAAIANTAFPSQGCLAMSQSVVQRVFFSILLAVVTIAFLWLILGFLQPIFWAVAFGIVMYPLHARLAARLGGRGSVAAGISTLGVVLIVILPLALIAGAVTVEAASLYERVSQGETGLADLYRLIS